MPPFNVTKCSLDSGTSEVHTSTQNVQRGGETMKRKSRQPSILSESLHRRLNAYASAASAAGVGMLALAQPSQAKIVYTKANQQIPPNTHYDLDLNHDRITDFTISNAYSATTSFKGAGLFIAIPAGNFVRGYPFGFGKSYRILASALPARVKLRASKKFRSNNGYPMPMGFSYTSVSIGFNAEGPWRNATNLYLGLKFAISGQTHYGWARLTSNCANFQCQALLTGYAYETVANKAIITGKTKGPDVVAIEPATIGHLARGASGLAAWRRTNSVAASH